MSNRKIVPVPALGGLYAMPRRYDPAQVKRADATHDGLVCSATAELAPYQRAAIAAARLAWDKAGDGEGAEAEEREARAEKAFDANDAAWDDALRAADLGDLDALRSALTRAQTAAAALGDDTDEKAALALVVAA